MEKLESKKESGMKNVNKLKWALCMLAAVLAAMGLCFAWRCPLDCVYGVDSGVFLFKKQLLWNVVGVAACTCAAFVPWRKWLKLAPLGMVVWFALMVVAVGFSRPIHGSQRWADLGVVSVNVNLVLVLSWALFASWLCSKKLIRPWMVLAIVGGLMLAYVYFYILGNANRLSRICAFWGLGEAKPHLSYAQDQMKAAYAAANWFGDANRSLRYLPIAYADSMPSASALIFGKWFPLAVAVLFAMFGGFLTWGWMALKNPSKRMFILFWGFAVVFSATYSFGQSVGLLPVFGFSPPLAGCGGSLAVTFWIGLGIVLSALSGEADDIEAPALGTFAASGVWIVLFIVFAVGVVKVSAFKRSFNVPSAARSVLGIDAAEIMAQIGIRKPE